MSSASAAPRYPTAASPNAVPDPTPSSAAREVQPPAIARSERLSFGSETRIDAGGRDENRRDRQNRDPVAEQDQAEHRDLQQLGLGVGDPEREIALLHAAQEQRGGRDLAQRGDQQSTTETAV